MSSKRTSRPRAAKTRSAPAARKESSAVDNRPSLWIIAGANGSGKTTAYREARLQDPLGTVWIINPDALAARIATVEKRPLADANLEAVQRIERWLDASIDAHQTVGVETVLSTEKYRRLVQKAKQQGFRINLVYVVLNDVELNISRVAARVAKGGHDVPEHKIRERRVRSFQQLPWFLANSDRALIYDNSEASPSLLFERVQLDTISIHGPLFAELKAAVLEAFPDYRAVLDGVT